MRAIGWKMTTNVVRWRPDKSYELCRAGQSEGCRGGRGGRAER